MLTNPMGDPRVYFDTTYLPRWIQDRKSSSGAPKAVLRNGEYILERGYFEYECYKFNYRSYPKTGLAHTNFELSFDFKTAEREAPLFYLYSADSPGSGRDKDR